MSSAAGQRALTAKPGKENVLRVLLADDHPLLREGLKQLVNAESDMMVVGESADGRSAWEAAKTLAPDVLIMDLSMVGLGGIEATQLVRKDCPATQVIVLTFHEERAYLSRVLEAGAKGYVLKQTASEELLRAIRTVGKGGTYIDPAMAGGLVEEFLAVKEEKLANVPELSKRELEILIGIAKGFSIKEIGARLGLSAKTVETYRARGAEKLGLKSRVDIVRYAAARGWLVESGGR